MIKALVRIDPNEKFGEVSDRKIVEACGLLPMFALDDNLAHLRLKEALAKAYGFGELFDLSDKAQIGPDGTYVYPQDPDLHPLMKIERWTSDGFLDILYIYQYALVAFVSEDRETFVSRMD